MADIFSDLVGYGVSLVTVLEPLLAIYGAYAFVKYLANKIGK